MVFGIAGKVAIVTGAASGLGRVMALAFHRAGALVVLNDLVEISPLDDFGEESLFVRGDVAKEAEAKNIVDQAYATFGRVDILVNNAGLRNLPFLGVDNCSVIDMEVHHFDRIIAVNLRGPFLLCRAVLPIMIKARQGSIINISSGAGQKGVPGKAAYSASKHGLEGFTKSLAEEVRNFGIRVNALAPGGRVDVDGRGGLPPEVIVPAALFLASDESSSVTGQTIVATKFNETGMDGKGERR